MTLELCAAPIVNAMQQEQNDSGGSPKNHLHQQHVPTYRSTRCFGIGNTQAKCQRQTDGQTVFTFWCAPRQLGLLIGSLRAPTSSTQAFSMPDPSSVIAMASSWA